MWLLTNKELMGVKQFAWLFLLQFVGFIHKWSQRSFPVNSSLTEAFSVQPISRHPQKHTLLQYVRKHLCTLPLRLRVREWKKNYFRTTVKLLLWTWGGRGGRGWRGCRRGGDPATFWAGDSNFLHQWFSVVQGHMQAEIWKKDKHLVDIWPTRFNQEEGLE